MLKKLGLTAHENLDYQVVQNNSFMTLPDGKPLSSVGVRRGYSEMGRVTGPDFMEQVIAATEKSDAPLTSKACRSSW